MKHPANVRQPGEGRRIGVVGDVYHFLATAKETNGKYTTFRAMVSPGSSPPPHTQSRELVSFQVS